MDEIYILFVFNFEIGGTFQRAFGVEIIQLWKLQVCVEVYPVGYLLFLIYLVLSKINLAIKRSVVYFFFVSV